MNAIEGLQQARELNRTLLAALEASAGYLRNAKIDLETGASKATAIRTIEGGLRMVEAAIASAKSSNGDTNAIK